MSIFRGITLKLLILVAVVSSVPLSIMGGITYFSMKGQMEQGLVETLRDVSSEIIFLLDEFMISRGVEVTQIAGDRALYSEETAAVAAALDMHRKHAEHFTWLGVVGADGVLKASAGTLIAGNGKNDEQTVSDFAAAALSGKRLIDTDDSPGETLPRFVVYLEKLDRGNGAGGWLAAQMSMDDVVSITNRVQIGETGRATLFNHRGILIGHPNKARYGYNMSKYPIMYEPIQQNKGNPGGEFLSGDGRMKFGITNLLPRLQDRYGVKWGIIVDQTLAELYAPVQRLSVILSAVGVFASVVAMIAGLIFSLRLTSPLKKLLERLHNISSGEADLTQYIEVSSHDEIG